MSVCGYQSEPPVPSCSSSKLCRLNMFLSSKSQRRFGLSHQISRCTFQRDKVEFVRLAHSLGQMFRCFSKICRGPSMKVSYKQICILLRHLFSESDSFFRLAPVCLVVCLVVCTLLLVFALHPDSLMMKCVSQGKFNVQILSNLINPNSKHTVQQQKAFHV